MNQFTRTKAGFVALAGATRLVTGREICAYPWHITDSLEARNMSRLDANTKSKFHHRWPGDPSS